jgi:hypothetical protein
LCTARWPARAGRRFFEKENQKTFGLQRALPKQPATASKKFFASFFQKRSAWLSSDGTASAHEATNLSAHNGKRALGAMQIVGNA